MAQHMMALTAEPRRWVYSLGATENRILPVVSYKEKNMTKRQTLETEL